MHPMRPLSIALVALVATLLAADLSSAQTPRYSVEGVVHDSAGVGLPSATIVALTRGDSTLARFSTSGRDGSFTVRRLEAGEYILQITYVGYQMLYHDFEVINADVKVGTLIMQEQAIALDEFIVSADRIPMSVGRDTIVYNAQAFGARPNEVVEDLLRRLPGIEVDRDGSIRAHGEDVENVLVEGKEFFGSDPTIATKNLPAQSVDKVEVYDKESDKAELTGVPDGNEEKTINLELTEDAKSGYFGNLTGGLGGENTQQGRYDAQGNLFRFSPSTQISLLSSANNVSRQGFGAGQLFSLLGAGSMTFLSGDMWRSFGSSGGLGGGLSQSLNVGLNFSQDIGEKSSINSSYFVSHLDATQDRTANRQQVLGSGISALSNLSSYQENQNLRHTADLYARINLGTGHDMRIRGNLAVGSTALSRSGVENTAHAQTAATVGVTALYDEETDNLDGDLRLVWRKRISESGRSLVAEGRIEAQNASALGNLDSKTVLEAIGDTRAEEELRQRQDENSTRLGHRQRIALTQPLGEGKTLEIFGQHRIASRRQDKVFHDLVDGREVRNDRLSQEFRQDYQYLSTGVELSINVQEHTWISSGLTLQHTALNGRITGAQEDIISAYTYLHPWARYRQGLGKGKRITLNYNGRSRVPSISELQPFTDNSDPLRLYVGNPALRPEYSHSVRGEFNIYDQFSFVGFSTGFSVGVTQREIINTRTVDEQLRQIRSRVNADAPSWNVSGRLGFESPIRPLGITVDLGNQLSFSSGTELINAVENTNNHLTNTVSVRLRNRSTEVIEAEAGLKATFNSNRYSLNTEANQSYVNSTVHSDFAWRPSEKLTLEASLWYRIFDRDVFGEQRPGAFPSSFGRQDNILRLDVSLSHLLLKERGEIRLEVFDIFDQNTGISYTNAASYVQEQRVLSLGRYVMLKFIYRPRGKGSGFFGF